MRLKFIFSLAAILIFVIFFTKAQPGGGGPGGGGDPDGNPVPIGGIEILLISGAALGVKKLIRSKKTE